MKKKTKTKKTKRAKKARWTLFGRKKHQKPRSVKKIRKEKKAPRKPVLKKSSHKEKKKNSHPVLALSKRVFFLLPEKIKKIYKTESSYAGLEDFPYVFVAMPILIGVLAAIVLPFVFGVLNYSLLMRFGTAAASLIAAFFIPYIVLSLKADARRRSIETVLPDLLLLTSSNMKSGLLIDRALLFSARPEFGVLGEEVRSVALEIFGGLPLNEAFKHLTTKIKSQILERTVDLLIEGIKSGGAVAQLLEESATDIRNTEILRKEIKSSVMSYVIFIFIAAILGAPFLFGVSTFLVLSTVSIWGGTNISPEAQEGGGFITISAPDIDMGAFNTFIGAAIILTATFAGILISMIQTGKATQSVKYIPVFVGVGLALYFATRSMLLSAFGAVLGI